MTYKELLTDEINVIIQEVLNDYVSNGELNEDQAFYIEYDLMEGIEKVMTKAIIRKG